MNYCNPEGFRNEIKELLDKGDIDALYHWFDGGVTKEGAFDKGSDVFKRVIRPYADKYLKGRRNVALDLGYGLGTKIQEALHSFPKVYGIDVHDEFDFALENLEVEEGQEVMLLKGDGETLPVSDNEVDFVYSWIVFCHLGTVVNVNKYLWEIMRVLKEGGVAVIFFTRLIRSGNSQSWKEVQLDMEKERSHPMGYREGGPESKVRTISLVMGMQIMKDLAESVGFKFLEETASWDDTKAGRVFHGQYGIVLRKPVAEKPKAITPKKDTKKKDKKTKKKSSLIRR